MSNSIEIKAIALKTLLTKENHKVLFEQGEILTVKYDTDGTVHIYTIRGTSKHSTAQKSREQHSIAQHSTAQHSTLQHLPSFPPEITVDVVAE
jgi:hypothetical protein